MAKLLDSIGSAELHMPWYGPCVVGVGGGTAAAASMGTEPLNKSNAR